MSVSTVSVSRPVRQFFKALGSTLAVGILFTLAPYAGAQDLPQDQKPAAPAVETLHPALFLVGDSITATGNPKMPPAEGARGPYGMGWEVIPQFDPNKIHVYNVGRGGRSTRGFIAEGAWAEVLARLQPGDYLTIMFGHNEEANSMNYPDRATIMGSGDESVQIGFARPALKIHTYGWYLKEYVAEAKAKGATMIICSPVPRSQWVDGKIKRGFDGYVQWAKEAAQASGAPFIDLNTLSADKYDKLGQQGSAALFADTQHPTRAGAKLNAASMIEGIKALGIKQLTDAIIPAPSAKAPEAAPAIRVAESFLSGTMTPVTGSSKLVRESEIEFFMPALQH